MEVVVVPDEVLVAGGAGEGHPPEESNFLERFIEQLKTFGFVVIEVPRSRYLARLEKVAALFFAQEEEIKARSKMSLELGEGQVSPNESKPMGYLSLYDYEFFDMRAMNEKTANFPLWVAAEGVEVPLEEGSTSRSLTFRECLENSFAILSRLADTLLSALDEHLAPLREDGRSWVTLSSLLQPSTAVTSPPDISSSVLRLMHYYPLPPSLLPLASSTPPVAPTTDTKATTTTPQSGDPPETYQDDGSIDEHGDDGTEEIREELLVFEAHTDIGLLTIAPLSTTPALQIRRRDSGGWVQVESLFASGGTSPKTPAPPIQPKRSRFLVFGGDALQQASHGMFVAAQHRVVMPSHRAIDRFSFPFFQRPEAEAVINAEATPSPPSLATSLHKPCRFVPVSAWMDAKDYA
ncbi:hypothetical protein QOT17_002759 [Balamuthia mandrillaris]